MEEYEWLTIEIALWSKICKGLKSRDIVNLSSTCSTLWEELKKERARAVKRLLWRDDYLEICLKTKHLDPSDYLHKKLPLYTQISSEEKIRVSSNTENGYRFETPTPDEYCITGVECNSLSSLPSNCSFSICYNEMIMCTVGMKLVAVLQEILGLEKNMIPLPMIIGGMPLPSSCDVRIKIGDDGYIYEDIDVGFNLEITYLLERMKTPNPDPFIIYQYQSQQSRILDGDKTVEAHFSHYISYILIQSEPFYDGPIEAVFEFDDRRKKRVLLLPEHKSFRFDNWRVFRLRGMKPSSLDQYPLISNKSNLINLHFLGIENRTKINISIISANNPIIRDGRLTHPSMLSEFD